MKFHFFIIYILMSYSSFGFSETSGGSRPSSSHNESQRQSQDAETGVPSLERSKCPAALKSWITDDYSDKMFGLKSEAQTCNVSIQSYKSHLNTLKNRPAANTSQQLNNLMSEELKTKINPQLKSFISSCQDLSPLQSQQVLSRFYSSSLKIENANQQALDEIAYLDSMDPQSLSLSDIECNNVFPDLRKNCTDYRKNGEQCRHKNKERFDRLSRKTRANIETIKKLNKAHQECLSKVNPKQKCEQIKSAIIVIENDTPWIKQDEFKKILAGKPLKPNEQVSQDVVSFAMKHQFEATRKNLSDFIKKNNQMMRCMMYTTQDSGAPCDYKDMRTQLNKYPLAELPFKPQSQAQRELATYIETDQCLQERGEDREQTLNTLKNSATDAALTVLSAGTVGVVAGVKALSTANRVAKIKNTVGVGALAAGSARSAQGINEAFSMCEKAFPDVAITPKPEEVRKLNVCEDSKSAEAYQNIEEKNNCVVDALLSATEFLPIIGSLPGGTRLFQSLSPEELAELYKDPKMRKQVEEILARNGQLNDVERMKAADTLLNRKLSPEAQKCMIAAHNIASDKSYGNYSQSELIAKKSALSRCSNVDGTRAFSATDITLLMRSGVTGKTPFNSPDELKQGANKAFAAFRDGYIVDSRGNRTALSAFEQQQKASAYLTQQRLLAHKLMASAKTDGEKAKALNEAQTALDNLNSNIKSNPDFLNMARNAEDYMALAAMTGKTEHFAKASLLRVQDSRRFNNYKSDVEAADFEARNQLQIMNESRSDVLKKEACLYLGAISNKFPNITFTPSQTRQVKDCSQALK